MLPNQAIENIPNDKVGLKHHKQESHMCKCKLTKLELVMAFPQVHHEEHHTKYIEAERDEMVMVGHVQEEGIRVYALLKVQC